MNRKISLTGLLLFVVGSCFAQSALKGKIISSDGTPAAGVNVTLKGTSKGTVTEDDGSYTIKNVKAGQYELVAYMIGLKEQKQTISLKDGEATAINFTLTEDAKALNEVMVKAVKSYNRQMVTVGKLPIKAMDLPQSIAVVDKEVLSQQQATHMSDVLKNVNGVYQMGSTGGVQQEIAGRGFAFGSNNTFKNGIRFNNGIMPEISSLDRVEVLKGSAAILYGNVAAGGVLNLVTKKPTFEKGGEVSFRTGSYDFYKPVFDVYGAINNSNVVAYRLNGSYEKSRSFRDNVNAERFYVNPSFLIKATDKLDILVEGDYLKDNRTVDYGVGAINYQLVDVPRNRFLGATWSYNKVEQMSATVTTTYHINNNWEVRNISGLQNYTSDLFGTTRPNASSNFVAADGKWIRGLQRTGSYEEYYLTEFDVTGRFNTGKIKHTLLAGIDADKYLTSTTAYNAVAKYDSVNILDPTKYKQRTDIPTLTENTLTQAPINRVGAYVQDLIGLTRNLKLLAGVRYSYLQTESEVYTYAKSTTTKAFNFDQAFTPRVGLVYQPMTTMSVFASYSNSFVPNTGSSNLDVNGRPLPPSLYTQYEAGVKNELFNGILTANVTGYQIVNSNLVQSVLDSLYPNAKEMGGEVTSRGVEVDVMTKSFHGFSVIAGYSYNKTFYSKSNTYEVGSLLRYNPNHTANASLYYAFDNKSALKGLNLGLSVMYMGERVAGRSTRYLLNGKELKNDSYKLMAIPSFTQVDLSVGYQIQNVSLRLRMTNLFDVLSYHVHDDNSVNPIAPRQFMATLSYKF
jgi:iron complex outermembrane receptor protein